jgi:Icc-related predicted phosphoesterase
MKLTFFSDTHTKHEKVQFSGGDVLIFCGDLTRRGDLSEVKEFSKFLSNLNYKYKIVIAGNHDFSFEDERKELAEDIFSKDGIIYLNDSGIEIDGIKFWGSPIQPWFQDWAFNRARGEEIALHWNLIPQGTDVLITHGPPSGILDLCYHGERVGCSDLLKTVKEIKPKIHAFGHIHESAGTIRIDETLYVNACSLNKFYEYLFPPIDLEI